MPDVGTVRLEQRTAISVRRRSCDSRDAGAHGDVQDSRADSAVGGGCQHSRERRERRSCAAGRLLPDSARVAQGRRDHAVVADAAADAFQNPQQHAGIARAGRFAGAPGSAAFRLSRRHARPARVRDRFDRRLQDRGNAAHAAPTDPTWLETVSGSGRAKDPTCASRRSAGRRWCSLLTIARVDVATAPGG